MYVLFRKSKNYYLSQLDNYTYVLLYLSSFYIIVRSCISWHEHDSANSITKKAFIKCS